VLAHYVLSLAGCFLNLANSTFRPSFESFCSVARSMVVMVLLDGGMAEAQAACLGKRFDTLR
jgi:hypothetical protein